MKPITLDKASQSTEINPSLRKRMRKFDIAFFTVLALLLIVVPAFLTFSFIRTLRFQAARDYMRAGDFASAIPILEGLGNFYESTDMLNNARYSHALYLLRVPNPDFEEATTQLTSLPATFRRTSTLIQMIPAYRGAYELYSSGYYSDALAQLDQIANIPPYDYLAELPNSIRLGRLNEQITAENYTEALETLRSIDILTNQFQMGFDSLLNTAETLHISNVSIKARELLLELQYYLDYASQTGQETFNTLYVEVDTATLSIRAAEELANTVYAMQNYYNTAMDLFASGQYESAREIFLALGNFNDSVEMARQAHFNQAMELYSNRHYEEAKEIFSTLGDFKNSAELVERIHGILERLRLATTFSAGENHAVAILSDGQVFGFHHNERIPCVGQSQVDSWNELLMHPDNQHKGDIVSVSAGGTVTIGLTRYGYVLTAGSILGSPLPDTSDWRDIIAVSAGELFFVGLQQNGTIVATGHPGDGQTNVAEWYDNGYEFEAIATGLRHTVGLMRGGLEIRVTGLLTTHERIINEMITPCNPIIAIAAGGGHTPVESESGNHQVAGGGHTLALLADGTVIAAGDNRLSQTQVTTWDNITAIATGTWHSVGLRTVKSNDGVVTTTIVTTHPTYEQIHNWYQQFNWRIQFPYPNDLSTSTGWRNIVAISAGHGFTMGLVEHAGYFFVTTAGYCNARRNPVFESLEYGILWHNRNTSFVSP